MLEAKIKDSQPEKNIMQINLNCALIITHEIYFTMVRHSGICDKKIRNLVDNEWQETIA